MKQADVSTPFRRMFLGLIGQPPKPDVVDTYIDDKEPENFEKVVDWLLASEHVGERLAICWLGVFR